jgi:hypothetical protein
MLLPPEASQVAARLVREIARVRQERKALRLTLRAVGSLFGCERGEIFLYRRAGNRLYRSASLTENEVWASELVMAFFRNEKPPLPHNAIMAPVRAGDRIIGVIALGKDDGFKPGTGKIVTEMLRIVGSQLGYRRELSESGSEVAIARAILSGVAPGNVVYRVFHLLRRFIDYDHGATLVGMLDDGRGRILARQVSWTSGKSNIVGTVFPFGWSALPAETKAFIVSGEQERLRESLGSLRESASPPRQSILAGSICAEGRTRAFVEVSSQQANFFVDKDVRTLSRFLPYLMWCLKAYTDNSGGHHE